MAVQIHLLNLTRFLRKEHCAGVNQAMNLSTLHRDIGKVCCHATAELFCNYSFDYLLCMKMASFCIATNLEGAIYSSTVYNFNEKNCLKYGYNMAKLVELHCCRFVDVAKNGDDLVQIPVTLHLSYAFRIDGKPFCQLKRWSSAKLQIFRQLLCDAKRHLELVRSLSMYW